VPISTIQNQRSIPSRLAYTSPSLLSVTNGSNSRRMVMKVEIQSLRNNDDGSCDVEVTTDAEGTTFLLRYGIVSALKDAIQVAKNEYTPRNAEELKKESNLQVANLQAELDAMRDILGTYDEELRQANELIVRLQKEPLSDERIMALYRRSMDWRQFARDIEEEHGVKRHPIDISLPEEDGYDE
jgi:hypothetical protein